MKQLLLWPDPRPLVERLGSEFFAQAPERPGVYLMRDSADRVLYVGKAKNLRKRLGSYRVANPDRMRRRHLRLLRAVARIELQECPDESAALATEALLLRRLRPSFNRAGTWPGPQRFVACRISEAGLELAVLSSAEPGWYVSPPLGAGALPFRAAIARLFWCALWPGRGYVGMPEGWFAGRLGETLTLKYDAAEAATMADVARLLGGAVNGESEALIGWIRERTAKQQHPFEVAMIELDLEALGVLERVDLTHS